MGIDETVERTVQLLKKQMVRELTKGRFEDMYEELAGKKFKYVFKEVKVTQFYGGVDVQLVPAKKAKAVMKPPGFKLHRMLSCICPKKFKERELDALLADGTELHQQKLAEGDEWSALAVRASMRWWLIWTVFGGVISSIVSACTGAFKSSSK